MDDIAFRSASALAAAIRHGEIGSRQLLEHYLQRIERFNPHINAVVTLDAARARTRADQADAARARGENWGPLHGLPMTVKDLFETEGLRTTAGAPPLRNHVPAANAASVQRLVDAGAVIFGKTNVSMFGMDMQAYNPIFGTTNSPWDPARTPGGSSGGSAAALACGLTALELGSDLAGSLRIPAHYCGVYCHKPSHGLVSLRGHIPGPPGTLTEPDLAVAGPLALQAEHVAADDHSIAGEFIRASTMRHRDWIVINEARLRMRAAWADFFRSHDVLLCPVTPTAALLHDHSEPLTERMIQVNGKPQSYLSTIAWSGLIGVAHLPATVAPVGRTTGGLPLGIQIVGPYLEDFTPIAFARELAGALGGFEAPPGY